MRRDTRPRGDDGRDVVLVDLLLHHRRSGALFALGELLLELGEDPVLDLGDAREIAGALLALGLHAQLVDLPLDVRHALQRSFSRDQRAASSSRTAFASASSRSTGSRTRLRLVRHRGELDLELPDAPVGLVELDRRRVDLHPQPRRRLVDEVDRLVGEEAVGDVPVGEHRGGDERGVADLDAVVRLVALLEAAEDRDRVRDRRLTDEDRLEAALERRVLLDVLAVLVERRRADRAQLAAREHRLQQVGRVDGAFGGTGADDRVQLVDEEDDLAGRVLDLREDGLQPLLELAAVLRAGEERADVERPDALALEALGHVARDDALREPFDDRRLPHAGLADEHRVVLRARESTWMTRRISSSRPMTGSSFPDSASAVRSRPYFSSAWYEPSGSCDVTFCPPRTSSSACRSASRGRRRARAAGARPRRTRPRARASRRTRVEHAAEPRRRLRLTAARHGRQLPQSRLRLRAELARPVAGAIDERPRQLLVEERDRQVVGRELGVAGAARELLRRGDRLLALQCQLLEVHVISSGPDAATAGRARPRACRSGAPRRSRRGARARAAPCAPASSSSSCSRSTCSTPARLSPSSVVSRWMRRRRSTSASE